MGPDQELSACFAEGSNVSLDANSNAGGEWQAVSAFDGYGCNSNARRKGKTSFHMRPEVAKKAEETHACLVLGPQVAGGWEFSCNSYTQKQLRMNSEPNPHEVGWLVWNYTDNEHFYYLIAKPNGWELGKRDPSYPGGQRFLATGEGNFPIHNSYELRASQTGATMDAWIDGQHLATFTDMERPYLGGRIGFYCEDADVYFDTPEIRQK